MDVHISVRSLTATVSCSHHPAVVSVIKALPPTAREWDPARRVWTVSARFVDGLADRLRARGFDVEVEQLAAAPRQPWLTQAGGRR